MFFKRNKYKKYKQIVFVDTENVGLIIPKRYSKENFYIFFAHIVSHKRGTATGDFEFYCSQLDNTELVDISSIVQKLGHQKNLMDFILVAAIGERLPFIQDKEIIISSKDKGFLGAIAYIQSRYPQVNIHSDHYDIVQEQETKQKEKKKPDVQKNMDIYPDAWPQWLKENLINTPPKYILTKFNKAKTFKDFYGMLNTKQKKKFYLIRGHVPVSEMLYGIRYDIYKHEYRVEFGQSMNDFVYITSDKNAAILEMEKTLAKMTTLAECFQSHEVYQHLAKLKLTPFVLEANSKHEPLLNTMCTHMDINEAMERIAQI